jgi:4-cresol dehydrogenase (hydroxylating)
MAKAITRPILPAGLTAADFADALEQFRKIVGKDNVYTGDQLSGYVDPYSIADEPDAHVTPAAIAPDSAEQVQAILRVANQFRVPL